MKMPLSDTVTKPPGFNAGRVPLAWLRMVGQNKKSVDDIVRATSWLKCFEIPRPAFRAKPLRQNALANMTALIPAVQPMPASSPNSPIKHATTKRQQAKTSVAKPAAKSAGKQTSDKAVNAEKAMSPRTFPSSIRTEKLKQVCNSVLRETVQPVEKVTTLESRTGKRANRTKGSEPVPIADGNQVALKKKVRSEKEVSKWRSGLAWRAAKVSSNAGLHATDNVGVVKTLKRAWGQKLEGPAAPMQTLLASRRLQKPVAADVTTKVTAEVTADRDSALLQDPVATTAKAFSSASRDSASTTNPATLKHHPMQAESIKRKSRTSTPSAEQHAVAPVIPEGTELLGLATATKAQLQHSDVVATTPIGPAVNAAEHALHTHREPAPQVHEPELAEQLKQILNEEARRHGISV